MTNFGSIHSYFLAAAVLAMPVCLAGMAQAPLPPKPEVEVSRHAPAEFAGVWDYNALESINIATGKPEQAPRSATQRGGAAGAAAGRAAGGAGRGGRSFGDSGGGLGAPPVARDVGPTPDMVRAARDLTRDLMEVPEQLTVTVTPSSITFVDDLERGRTYPTDGSKQKYRIGASQFDARVDWKDSQLRKDIDGGLGFKMSEVYFLSPDAKRLFVILRVAGNRKDAPPIGADRVYDRVEAGAAPAGVTAP